jgi:hypothetical protein
MREIWQPRSFANLPVVMLRREGERVIDPVRISGGHGCFTNLHLMV